MEPFRKEPPKPFKVSLLLDTEYAVNDGILYTTYLPEEVIVDILGERLLQSDCRKGLIFDGLESMFTPDELVSTALLLKAFQNRKHIYFIELELDLEGARGRIVEMENEKKKMQGKGETLMIGKRFHSSVIYCTCILLDIQYTCTASLYTICV